MSRGLLSQVLCTVGIGGTVFTLFVPVFDPYIALAYIPVLPLLTASCTA